MANMGTADLVTVAEDFDIVDARRMAVHAAPLLERRRVVATLAEAVAGCSVIIGTTARGGPYRERTRDIREIASEAVSAADPDRPSALVFGSEPTGLTNEEIAVCHGLAFIPTATADGQEPLSSLNLAQAVMVCLYEFMRARMSSEEISAGHPTPRADAADVERMALAMKDALAEIGFLSELSPLPVMAALRSVFGRAALDEREVRIMSGIARQIMWYARGGHAVAADKRMRGQKLR